MRTSGGAAILLGVAVGVAAALLGRSETSTKAPPSRALARASDTVMPPARAPAPAPAEPPISAAPSTETEPATPAASASSSASDPSALPPSDADSSALPPSDAGPNVVPSFPVALPRPALTNAAELERAEIRCYETDPEDCGLAAAAYAAGVLVPRDAARAERLRKIELTRLKRRCEQRSPHACLVLAGRSHVGDGVPKDERRAGALLEHARELCRRGASSECEDGEPK
jgi:hypothetical protein